MPNYANKTELENTLAALIASIQKNTDVISQFLAQAQVNSQGQIATDRTILKDIGSNKVNVINYIDPDTFAGALANNDNYVTNLSASLSAALSASLAAVITKVLEQYGLINIVED